jgi:DNA repair protein RadC
MALALAALTMRTDEGLQKEHPLEVITAQQAHCHLRSLMSPDVEEFWVLALGPSKQLLCSKMLFRGTVDSCTVHPRDIFRFACLQNASSVIIAHNHPSNDPEPSDSDLQLTEDLVALGRLIQIPVLDHLIISDTRFVSLARRNPRRFQNFVNSESYPADAKTF